MYRYVTKGLILPNLGIFYQMSKFPLFISSVIFVSCLSLSLLIPLDLVWGQFQDIPTVSTRKHFDVSTGDAIDNNNTFYKIFNFSPQITSCLSEVATYIHGVWVGNNSMENPNEIFDRLKLSLQSNGYNFPLIGYSWDSDTEILPQGWNIAKHIAAENGERLGIFIMAYKQQCPQTEIRIISHSLGARVILEALDYLNKNTIWNNNGFKISSVHLIGAAVDNEEVSTDPNDSNDDNLISLTSSYDPSVKSTHGISIVKQVDKFYNLFNEGDNALEIRISNAYYPFFERDFALGNDGADRSSDLPANYLEYSVKDQIADIDDADADNNCDLHGDEWVPSGFGFGNWEHVCTIKETGDNHFGYIGFRSNETEIIDDGAVNRIVNDWNTHN